MAFQTAAGASLKVSAAHPATFDVAGYTTLIATATTVGEVTNLGEFGKEFAVVTHNPLADRGTKKAKGSYNNGTITPNLAFDAEDAGQIILETALNSDDPVSCFITLQDGTVYAFEGVVTTYRPSVGEVDSVVTASCTIEITHNPVVRIDAP